jgi:hypothetical protein
LDVHSIRTPPAFVAWRFHRALAAPTVRCIELRHALQEPAMQTTHLPIRVTSLLLAALVTGSLLGSMNLIAAEQVDLARSSAQPLPAESQLAGQPANCVRG